MYLAYLYMCTWVRSENVNPDAFMITQDSKEVENLMGFHTSITMGYVESALFFCAMIETTKDRVKKTLNIWDNTTAHPLEGIT